jgi:polysaccharide deacetylase family protein (PEP-CTERM system associated)
MRPDHHFTIDVEEYFHPTALSAYFPRDEWDGLERRSPAVLERLLAFLAERNTRGTFFVVGWLAEQEPAMVRAIADAGHEVASHGYEHALLGALGPEGFRESIRRSKATLEDLVGQPVLGYRAPSFSIVPGREWAFDVLLEEGYRYDASLFPVRQHPTYGYPDVPRDPFWIVRPAGRLAEFPSTTASVLGTVLPASGGAYFRILPYALVRAGLRQASDRSEPGMFYLHPWELDDWVPPVAAPRLQRIRTFWGRTRTWGRMDRMLREFRFGRVDASLAALDGGNTVPVVDLDHVAEQGA